MKTRFRSQPVPFATYLSKRLRKYRVLVPAGLSLITGNIVGIGAIYILGRVDVAFLKSVAPHVSVLVETNDFTELQRFLSSISHEGGRLADVVASGQVIASTRARHEIGGTFSKPLNRTRSIFPSIENGMLVSDVRVVRRGGSEQNADIVLYSPLSAVVGMVVGSMSVVFVLSAGLAWLLATRISNTARKSLEPVERLDHAIRDLATKQGSVPMEQFEISELENIRETVLSTKIELERTTHDLTEAKAKELLAQAYMRLIHDLHTPVTALRQMIKISTNSRFSEEKRSEAREQMAELAEQVLKQVSSGKDNLALSIRILPGEDLNASVRRAIENVRFAAVEKRPVVINDSLPVEPVYFDHDPIMLGRAVSNLVSNAVDASQETVNVVVEVIEGRPRIKVSDDGPGMNPEDVSLHLVGRGKSKKADRSGIGLSSCNHIVRSHGGRIVYRASRSGGSEFEIRL